MAICTVWLTRVLVSRRRNGSVAGRLMRLLEPCDGQMADCRVRCLPRDERREARVLLVLFELSGISRPGILLSKNSAGQSTPGWCTSHPFGAGPKSTQCEIRPGDTSVFHHRPSNHKDPTGSHTTHASSFMRSCITCQSLMHLLRNDFELFVFLEPLVPSGWLL